MQTGLFINNEFVGGSETIDVLDPSTEKLITSVQAGMERYKIQRQPC